MCDKLFETEKNKNNSNFTETVETMDLPAVILKVTTAKNATNMAKFIVKVRLEQIEILVCKQTELSVVLGDIYIMQDFLACCSQASVTFPLDEKTARTTVQFQGNTKIPGNG